MSIRMLRSWIVDRYGPEHLAFAFFIAVAGTVSAGFAQLSWALPVTWLALGSMRLADDLIDRQIDGKRAPDRLLIREPRSGRSLVWFVPAGILLCGAVLYWRGESMSAVIAFGGMIACLGAWYLVRSRFLASVNGVHPYVLLGKYPALVSILAMASSRSVEPFIPSIVFAVMIVHEFLTHSAAPPSRISAMKKWRYLLFGIALVVIILIGGRG